MFVSFDGIDGCGKSTQLALFADWLRKKGVDVVTCRDPGGTELGERLRELLLGEHDFAIGPRAEALLYMASRAQLVEEVIRPALDAGKAVVSDRFLLANVVYQGWAGNLKTRWLWRIGRFATQKTRPDLVFLLDLNPGAAAARWQGPPDRMERRDDSFHQKVRQGFLEQARRCRKRIAVIDADRPVHVVQAEIEQLAEARFRELRRLPAAG